MSSRTVRRWLAVAFKPTRMLVGSPRPADQDLAALAPPGARLLEQGPQFAAWECAPGMELEELLAHLEALAANPRLPPCGLAVHAGDDEAEARARLRRLLALDQVGAIVVSDGLSREIGHRRQFAEVPGGTGALRLLAPIPHPPRPPLVGRAAELDRLLSCHRVAHSGRPLFVQLRGPAGVGKTRLISEFAREVAGSTEVITVGCRPDDQHRPFALVAQLMAGRIELEPSALEAAFGPAGLDWALLLGLTHDQGALTSRFRAFLALHRWLLELAQPRGLVLIIEDLHWLDESSETWLDFVLSQLDEPPQRGVMLLTSLWAGPPSRLAAHEIGHIELRLSPLDPQAARRLARLRHPEAADWELDHLVEAAQGSPLLLCELPRPGRHAGLELPHSVRTPLTRLIEHLTPAARETLAPAAAMGMEPDVDLLERLLPAETVSQGLRALEAAHVLVQPQPRRWSFSHHGFYRTAYEHFDERTMGAWHARLALLLEEPGSDPMVVAEHHERSGAGLKALPHLLAAARAARQRYAYLEARSALERALALAQADVARGRQVALELAEVALGLGDALATLQALGAFGPPAEPAERYRHAMLAAEAHLRSGELALAEVQLAAARAESPAGDPGAAGELELAEARLAMARGDQRHGLMLARRALTELGDSLAPRAMAHSLIGIALYRLVGPQAAIDDHRRALALREALGDPAAVGASLTNLGACYCDMGEWAEALQCYQQAQERFEAVGERHHQAVVLNNAGNLLQQQRRFAEAQQRFEEALALTRALRDTPGVAMALANLGNVHAKQGRHSEARRTLHQAIALMESHGMGEALAEAYQMAGMVELAAGQNFQASKILTMAQEACLKANRKGPLGIVARGMGVLALRAGRLPEAEEHARRSIDLLSDPPQPAELGQSWLLREAIARHLERLDEAEHARQQAEAFLRSSGPSPAPILST